MITYIMTYIRQFWISPVGMSLGLLLLASGGIGCGGGPKAQGDDPEAAHLVKVVGLIKDFESAHQGIPPADLDELKSWAVKEGKAQESDFISTRDKKPYEMPVPGGKPKKGMQLTVREAEGRNGKKFMAVSGGNAATEMSDGFFRYTSGEMVKKSKPKQTMPGS